MKQVTTDHSFVQQLVESGAITEDEARVHPQRNLITRAVGIHESVHCDYACFTFEPGDVAPVSYTHLDVYKRQTSVLSICLPR